MLNFVREASFLYCFQRFSFQRFAFHNTSLPRSSRVFMLVLLIMNMIVCDSRSRPVAAVSDRRILDSGVCREAASFP